MARKPGVSPHVPLTPRVLLILWALADGPQHGYRLRRRAEELGRGHVSISPASLYESMNALRRRGLIEHAKAPADADRDDKRRRYFRLTKRGRDVLKAEASRLAWLTTDLRRDGLIEARQRS